MCERCDTTTAVIVHEYNYYCADCALFELGIPFKKIVGHVDVGCIPFAFIHYYPYLLSDVSKSIIKKSISAREISIKKVNNNDINLIEQLNKKNEEKEKNEKKELEGDSENIKTITIKI